MPAPNKKPELLDPSYTYAASPNTSGVRKTTELIVMHYTVSDNLHNTVQWLCEPRAKASAHFVVGRDGAVVQLMPVDNVAWHAGRSVWQGRDLVNTYSVGVEIVNLGPLQRKSDGTFVSVAGARKVAPDDVFHGKHETDQQCPFEYWQKYPDAQLAAVRALVAKLRAKYPSIKDVVGHSDVAPFRKIDPGAALPADMLTARVVPAAMPARVVS